MAASLAAPGGANIGDDAPFDLRSYLGSDADDIFLDGWDDLPYVVGDDEGSEGAAHGMTRESLLPDDVLDELIRAHQVEEDSTENAISNRHGATSKVPDNKAKPYTKMQDASGNKQAHKQRNVSDAGSPSKAASDMPPATTIGQALAFDKTVPTHSSSNNTSKGDLPSTRKRRRVEDPSVLDMARRLLEARKSEQSTNLASETSTLCEDNHRLILYLKQLGEKLTKARLENTLLKQLVGENVGQGHAEQAQMLASSQPELAANMGREKSSRLSVADKVSALSVKRMHSQDGTPVACLRPSVHATSSPPAPETPSPPSMPIVNMSQPRTLGEVSRSQQQQQQQMQLIQQMQQQLQPRQLPGHHHHHQQNQQQQQQHQQPQHHHHHHHQQQQQQALKGMEAASGDNSQQFALQAAAAMQANASNPAGVLMDLLKLMEKQMKKGTSTNHTSS